MEHVSLSAELGKFVFEPVSPALPYQMRTRCSGVR